MTWHKSQGPNSLKGGRVSAADQQQQQQQQQEQQQGKSSKLLCKLRVEAIEKFVPSADVTACRGWARISPKEVELVQQVGQQGVDGRLLLQNVVKVRTTLLFITLALTRWYLGLIACC